MAEVEGELKELLDEVEDWDEEEYGKKSPSKGKNYLKQITRDLSTSLQATVLKEVSK